MLTSIGLLHPLILHRSGITADKYPLFYKVFFEWREMVLISASSLIFVQLIMFWRKRTLKYQMWKTIGSLIFIVYMCMIPAMNSFVYVIGGRFFSLYSLLSVTANDIMAYVAGRLFGRHSLIGLSPNKTIEGFIGGFFGSLLFAVITSQYCMQGNFWPCPPNRLDVGLFEDWQC